jgi:hypothetical protein
MQAMNRKLDYFEMLGNGAEQQTKPCENSKLLLPTSLVWMVVFPYNIFNLKNLYLMMKWVLKYS